MAALFIFMILRPPLDTLFPYTTLFRSGRTVVPLRPGDAAVAAVRPEDVETTTEPPGPNGVRGDRKSTRLNSSHTVISYAVFCLKKTRCSNSSRERLRSSTHGTSSARRR